MINVSNAFKQELFNDNRKYFEYVDITLSGGGKTLNLANEDLWNGGLTIEDAVSKDNSFDIGSAIINKCTVVINNIYDKFSEYDFGNAVVVPYVGLKLPDNTIERIRKGTFIVDEAKYNGSIITLSCLDNMSKFDKKYSETSISYPATLNQIARDACDRCGVSLQTYNFPHDDFIVQTRPDDKATTFREVISWCAQIAGCFCRCDTLGRLEFKWYDQRTLEQAGLDGGIFDSLSQGRYVTGDNADGGSFSPWNTGYIAEGGEFGDRNNVHIIYSLYSMDISVDDVVITGVRIAEKNKEDNKDAITTYQSGTDGYMVSIENNELIKEGAGQTIVGWLGEQLIGFRFRKGSFAHSSDPTIEAGDVGFLIDRKQNVYATPITFTKFSTGSSQTTKASAQTPARNSAARFSAGTKNYVDYRKDIEKERTDREKALEELKVRIDNSPGLFTTEVKQPNGSTIFYMHDKPTLAESMIVWKMTAEAWGVSTDGGKTYNAGMTVDGDTIVRILTAVGVNADWIKTGALKIQKGNKTMVNMDFDAKRVELYPDSFALSSGETIDSIAQDKADDALADAKTYANTAAKKAVDEQTQTSIFNKLTNNGALKGIYMENGELYVNATYIKTGYISASRIRGDTLILGGQNNQKGKLSIRNDSDTEIGRWDKDGIYVNGGSIYSKTSTTGVSIYGGRFHLTYGDTDVGYMGTNYLDGYSSYRGIDFDLEDTGAYMMWAAKETSADNLYVAKLLYANKTFSKYTAGKLYVMCDTDFRNWEIQNAYINGLNVKNSFNIPNNVSCNIYSNIDFHNWEIKNAKIGNLVAADGYTPFSGTIYAIGKVVTNSDGSLTWYRGTLTVKSGIIVGASSNLTDA